MGKGGANAAKAAAQLGKLETAELRKVNVYFLFN
jgi:hypothetical protein